jgi:hypothetical protein
MLIILVVWLRCVMGRVDDPPMTQKEINSHYLKILKIVIQLFIHLNLKTGLVSKKGREILILFCSFYAYINMALEPDNVVFLEND